MPSVFARQTSSFPVGSVNEQYLVHLLLTLHAVQTMLTFNLDEADDSETSVNESNVETGMETDEDTSISMSATSHDSLGK